MRDRLVAEFGLLLCQRRIGRVYEKAGWMRVEGPTRFRQRSGMTTYQHDAMVLKLGMRDWPGGLIDLCGQPWWNSGRECAFKTDAPLTTAPFWAHPSNPSVHTPKLHASPAGSLFRSES
jgi:hypothetical protein